MSVRNTLTIKSGEQPEDVQHESTFEENGETKVQYHNVRTGTRYVVDKEGAAEFESKRRPTAATITADNTSNSDDMEDV